jgi:hypothetical protein
LNSPILKHSRVKDKITDIIVYSYQNIDSLHDYLAYFLLDLPFQTIKKVDFLYWLIALYMHKYGYFYLKEGRATVINIDNYINSSRYSNSGKDVSEPLIDLSLFSKVLPVTLTPSMSHLKLGKAFAKVKEGPLTI